MTWVGVLMGITGQALGMLLIVLTATLVGLLSLPLWVAILLKDLQWNHWYRQFKLSIRAIGRTVRESNPN
jgi:anaerobic C4-dicarboxylate transporter